MTPTQFLNNNISIKQYLTNMNRMISSNLVIWHALVFTWVFIFIKALSKDLPERIEIFIIDIVILMLIGIVISTGRQSFGCSTIFNFVNLFNKVLNTLYISIHRDAGVLRQVIRELRDIIPIFLLFFLVFLFLLLCLVLLFLFLLRFRHRSLRVFGQLLVFFLSLFLLLIVLLIK